MIPPPTTRKSINTNGNTKGIFPSVIFRGILSMEIFPRYTPRDLPWETKLKQSKKNDDVSFFTNGLTPSVNTSVTPTVILTGNRHVTARTCFSNSVGNSVHYQKFAKYQRTPHPIISVGIFRSKLPTEYFRP